MRASSGEISAACSSAASASSLRPSARSVVAEREQSGVALVLLQRAIDEAERLRLLAELLRRRGGVGEKRAVLRDFLQAAHEDVVRLLRLACFVVQRAEVGVRGGEVRRGVDDLPVHRDRVVDTTRFTRALRVFHQAARDLRHLLLGEQREGRRENEECGGEGFFQGFRSVLRSARTLHVPSAPSPRRGTSPRDVCSAGSGR